jgi:biotin carboxylase
VVRARLIRWTALAAAAAAAATAAWSRVRVHRKPVVEAPPVAARPAAPSGGARREVRVRAQGPLHGVPEIRRFFRTNETPVYFVSATAFNLLGIDRWVRNFRFVNYFDSFDGHHPHVFVPREREPRPFGSIEEIVNYLLGHKELADYVASRGTGKAAFLMFDEETEQLAAELGLEVAFPKASLRHRMDSKIVTTELGNEAGVPSVPNVLGRAGTYRELLELARGAGLGKDLVVQLPYGDSGQTTFFVANQRDWKKYEEQMVGEELKVMKRIEPRETAIEGVVTRHGTLVGPLMTELAGFRELTPYTGGWCGNDVFADVLTEQHRAQARAYMQAMGERLRREGYRGYFEIDFLADVDSGEMYLGELNPRVTGASSITNVTAVAYGDMPLFLFHLLEFMDVDYEIDVDELNERWTHPANIDEWAQFVLKQSEDTVELITRAPPSGRWRMGADGSVAFVRPDTDWHTVADENEAFYLRIAAEGVYRYKGADLGILVTRGRLMDDDYELTDRARAWIAGIKAAFEGRPAEEEIPPSLPAAEPFGFKML